ncbi:MAG: extracellular solute-binding protein [Anaerolinea sp.]|nr:extracellular solute-binding protein [Anaerolinea sp.]
MNRLTKLFTLSILLVLALSLMSVGVHAQGGVVLRYANWNLGTEEENNVQRQLVAAYVAAHPDVTVEFVDMSGEGSWDEKLTNFAARGELPDVWMADNTPYYVQNDWTADLTDMVAGDADWENVPELLRNAVTYEGRVLGLPVAQFVMGYFVNQDLFEAANLDAPAYGVAVEDFFSAIAALTDVQQGVLGTNDMENIIGWYASTQDDSLGWFSFDGTHMNYNSEAFKAGVQAAIDAVPYTWQGLTEEQKANFTAVGPWELFLNQEAGLVWDGGWAVPAYTQNATFNWDFVGIPGGSQAQVADIIVVSASSANPEAAYDFAKWMSFSSEGYVAEAEIAQNAGTVPTRMPVTITTETIDLYMSFVGDKPGLRMALENLNASVLESLTKIVPGYANARWNGKPGLDIGENLDVTIGFVFSNVATGAFQYPDLAPQLEEFANGILDEAAAAVMGS